VTGPRNGPPKEVGPQDTTPGGTDTTSTPAPIKTSSYVHSSRGGMSAHDRLIDALRAHGRDIKDSGAGRAQAQCPAHDDHRPSLSVGPRRDGKGIVVHCHAGCPPAEVLAALGLSLRDLFDDDELSAVYAPRRDYHYPDGRVVHRKPDKSFPQSGRTKGNSLFHADRVGDADVVYVVEGEKDVEAIELVGGTAVCPAMGAGKAHLADWSPLRGKHAVIVADKDEPGRRHAADVARLLKAVAASVKIVEAAAGKDAADHFASDKTLDEFQPVVEADDEPVGGAELLAEARNVFRRWLGSDYDTDTLDAMLAAVAVERFGDGGDTVWLLVVSGPGAAKTETVQSLDGVGAIIASSISSDAALLSATPKREVTKGATGGLLRKIGGRGVLVIKDVTSILAMNRDQRAKVLAALREVYDGRWYRDVGTDGGQTIPWHGRIAVIGAVTTAWDTAHAVISTMGDRFTLIRIDSTTGRQAAGRQAIGNTGAETRMRAELAEAVAGVIAGMNPDPISISDAEAAVLLAAADLVTLARTGVEYDYRGDVIDAHAPEMPTRFAKQLTQIVRGGVAIGMDRAGALRLAIRCARDSMPPLRLAIIDDLAAHPHSLTSEVRRRLDKPRNTLDRQLQALHILGVVAVDEQEDRATGRVRWFYSLADGVDPGALTSKPKPVPDLSLNTPNPLEERDGGEMAGPYVGSDISGNCPRRPGCVCGELPTPCYWCRAAVSA